MSILENEKVIELTDKYQQLSGRDKALLQFLSVFVVICIGYFLIYSPSVSAKQKATEQLQATEKTYRDIQKVVPQILQARQNVAAQQRSNKSNASNSTKSMTAMVNDSARKYTIIITKSTADGNDAISISGNDQVFDQLVLFIGDLNTTYGLNIETFNIKETDVSGKVDFSIKVRR